MHSTYLEKNVAQGQSFLFSQGHLFESSAGYGYYSTANCFSDSMELTLPDIYLKLRAFVMTPRQSSANKDDLKFIII